MKNFRCGRCGNVYPIKKVSQWSLDEADTLSPITAIGRLPKEDVICWRCEEAVFSEDAYYDEFRNLPRWYPTDLQVYRREYSGVNLDRPTIDWLRQNF